MVYYKILVLLNYRHLIGDTQKILKWAFIRIQLKKYSSKCLLYAVDINDEGVPGIYAINVVFEFVENIHNFLFDIQFMSFIL